MAEPVRVYPLGPVLDLCPEFSSGVLGIEARDVVALIAQYLESAGVELHVCPADLKVATAHAADLLDVLGAGSTRASTPALADGAGTEKR